MFGIYEHSTCSRISNMMKNDPGFRAKLAIGAELAIRAWAAQPRDRERASSFAKHTY